MERASWRHFYSNGTSTSMMQESLHSKVQKRCSWLMSIVFSFSSYNFHFISFFISRGTKKERKKKAVGGGRVVREKSTPTDAWNQATSCMQDRWTTSQLFYNKVFPLTLEWTAPISSDLMWPQVNYNGDLGRPYSVKITFVLNRGKKEKMYRIYYHRRFDVSSATACTYPSSWYFFFLYLRTDI